MVLFFAVFVFFLSVCLRFVCVFFFWCSFFVFVLLSYFCLLQREWQQQRQQQTANNTQHTLQSIHFQTQIQHSTCIHRPIRSYWWWSILIYLDQTWHTHNHPFRKSRCSDHARLFVIVLHVVTVWHRDCRTQFFIRVPVSIASPWDVSSFVTGHVGTISAHLNLLPFFKWLFKPSSRWVFRSVD